MITCTFENSNKTSLRHATVTAIIRNDKNEFLLIKRAPNLLNGGKYALVGGFVDRDETIGEAIIREMKEEVGLSGKISFLFRINDRPDRSKEDRQNIDFTYIVTIEQENSPVLNNEVTSIGWFSEESLPEENDFAFDHREIITMFLKHLKKQYSLPIIG